LPVSRAELDEAILEHILYVIVLPRKGSGEFSPFQGFSVNTYPVVNAIQHICTLPTAISELFRTRDEAIRMRSIGLSGYAIVLIELDFLQDFDGGLPLTCFVSDPNTRTEVERHIAASGRRGWLHLTTDERNSSVPKLWDFSRADFFSWSRSRAEAVIAEKRPGASRPAASSWRTFIDWPKEASSVETRSHNITLPTEIAIRSFNFTLRQASKPLSGNSDDEFALAISMAADELERIRHNAGADHHLIPGSPTLIVAVPSVYRHLSPNQLSRTASAPIRRAFRNILRQRHYTAIRMEENEVVRHGAEVKQMLEDRTAMALMGVRAEELAAYTAALSVSAASLVVPVLRCPPQVDRVRELLIRLAGMSRSKTPNAERRDRLAQNIGKSLRDTVPDLILQQIERHQHEGIKLLGDTPLELMPIEDLPLGLRATVSRMPTLPGNLLMRQALLRTPLLLQPDELTTVLIARAFDHGDPLREVLVDSIRFFNARSEKKLKLQIVDVSTRAEFIAAFNNFDGRLAIFDGHGAHERSDPQGTISIGSVRINPFELYGQIKIPPLLFLSACETLPLEGIESSVASAFLVMGARSVLGTTVPIDGRKAAILMARFMFRVTDFLPLLNTMIPWSQVISGMLRMSYVTDILRAMEKPLSISEGTYRQIHTEANIAINEFQPKWFEQMLDSLSAATSVPVLQLRDRWIRTCYFTDTLHYVHLGQPEHLLVVPQ
jgi:CHAT domain